MTRHIGPRPYTWLDVLHIDAAMLCELGERAYTHRWLSKAPGTAEYIRAWWPQ